MTTGVLTRLKPDELFNGRLKAAKAVISGLPWRKRFFERNPNWDNNADHEYLNRVYLGRSSDVSVTIELEAIAKEIDPSFQVNPI